MIIVQGSTIEILLGGNVAANQLPCSADYWDETTTAAPVGGASAANTVNPSSVLTLVAAPAASTRRQVSFLSVKNADTANATVNVQRNDGGTKYVVFTALLAPGQHLIYTPGSGFQVISAGAKGIFLRTTLLTRASSNHTTSTATYQIFLRGVGGGGGGGGISTVSSAGGGGGGGGSGSYAEKLFAVAPNTAYAYTCGTAGGGGAAGSTGTAGGTSTFVVSGTTVTCQGGLGGIGAAAVAGASINLGGAACGVSTNGDLNCPGRPGNPGIGLAAATVVSGLGASSPFGGGGNGLKTQSAGSAATGYGSGGSGACLVSGGAGVAGGAGTAGCWIVDEYT